MKRIIKGCYSQKKSCSIIQKENFGHSPASKWSQNFQFGFRFSLALQFSV